MMGNDWTDELRRNSVRFVRRKDGKAKRGLGEVKRGMGKKNRPHHSSKCRKRAFLID